MTKKQNRQNVRLPWAQRMGLSFYPWEIGSMKFASFRSALLLSTLAVLGLPASARADSIVHFTYVGSVPGGYDVQVYSDSNPTPITAKNFLRYIKNGLYDNTIIHRNLQGSIFEGGGYVLGDPANQEALPGYAPLSAISAYPAIVSEAGIANTTGTLAMILPDTSNLNSATSKWFVNLKNNSSSYNGCTVFGKVLGNGMNFIKSIDSDILTQDLSKTADYNLPDLTDVPLYTSDFDKFYFITIGSVTVTSAAWDGTVSSGDWDLASNWSGVYKDNNCVPGGAGVVVAINNPTSSPITLNMATSGRTVGMLALTGGNTQIAGSSTNVLTLDNIDQTAEITFSGFHKITAPVVLAGDAKIEGTGSLAISGGIAGDHQLTVASGTLTTTSINVDTLVIGTAPVVTTEVEWQSGANADPADWSLAANWKTTGDAPGGACCKVIFGNQSPNYPQVDLKSSDQTVGGITFADTTNTTIASSGQHSLTLDNNDETTEITVAGNHMISATVILAGNASIDGPGTLNFTGGVTGNHQLSVLGGVLNASSINVDMLVIGTQPQVAAVPEPSTIVLVSLALLGLLAIRWNRRC
jgi:cyclophilin family peptidyl-prolyl cis-trans isomerase